MADYGVYPAGEILVGKKEEELTNFMVSKPVLFYDPEDGSTPEMMRVRVRHRGRKYTVDLDLNNPDLFSQIKQAIPTCKILKSGARDRIEAYILELEPVRRPGPPPLYFRHHGLCRLADDTPVYVAGNKVQGLPVGQEYAIDPEVARAYLAYDEGMSVRQAIKAFWKVLKRDGDIILAVWGFMLISCLRSRLSALGITTYPSLVAIGRQSNGKTTVCQRFGLLYNKLRKGEKKPTFWALKDLGSTEASTIETISKYRDQAVFLDDRAKSISKRERDKRTEIMAAALRFASNDTERSKMSPTRQVIEQICTAGVMFASELELENASDISRAIIVHVRREMQDGDPRDRTVAATAFWYFLPWLLPRLDKVIDDLKEQLRSITGRHQRLQKNRVMILWALNLFMEFVQEQGDISEKEVSTMFAYAVKILDGIVDEQVEQIERLENSANISHYILDGIQKNVIERVSKKDVRKEEPLPSYYYVRIKERKDMIYIPTEVLYRYLTDKTPLRFNSEKAMDKQLLREKVVCSGQDGRVASARIDGKRYLGMRRADLVEAAAAAFNAAG